MQSKVKKREEVDRKDTWDLERIYMSDALWEEDFNKVYRMIETYNQYSGHLGDSAKLLKEAIDRETEISRICGKVYVYANMRYHQDTTNSAYQALAMRSMKMLNDVQEAVAFLNTEILALDEEWLASQLDSEAFAGYRRMFDELLRQKAHIRSTEVEALLAAAGKATDASSQIYDAFRDSDMVFDSVTDSEGREVSLTEGRYVHYLESGDREFRKKVYDAYYKQFLQYKTTLAALMSANVAQANFYAKARNYSSARQASLMGSDIPEDVYDSLIEAVHKYMPFMHRYVAIRKKMLKVDELHMYDVYVPLVDMDTSDIPYNQAKEMVLEGLKPLGEEYVALLKQGFENRWVDVYENEGKRSGAYSWGSYDTDPYVLMNYNNNLDSVFTLAHEMGHSLHSYYTRHNQPPMYGDYRLFVAEVASTCNEALLIHSLLKTTTERTQRMYLINHFMNEYKGTIYRQTMFAEFERNIHAMADQGQALTAEVISAEYARLNTEYFGPEMVQDEKIAMEWARIPHFYTPFYVYQYATGFSAALAIANRILKYGEPAVDDYKKFLKGGSTMSPIELLKLAGVDMTTPKPVEEALEYFGTLLDEFTALMG